MKRTLQIPEWANLSEAELRGEDPRPSVRRTLEKTASAMKTADLSLPYSPAGAQHPNCRCGREQKK